MAAGDPRSRPVWPGWRKARVGPAIMEKPQTEQTAQHYREALG
jgi:hypothetical protein